ncbi:MAG: transglutaminase family protein [Elusimicrobiaceae bacterium]|jgi:hypothetical protein
MSVRNPKKLPDNEIKALIALIANEDTLNAESLKTKLAEIVRRDPERIDTLIGENLNSAPGFVEQIVACARRNMLSAMFENIFKRNGEPDFEEGLFLISKFENPTLSLSEFTGKIDALADLTSKRVKDTKDLTGFLSAFSASLFAEQGFSIHPEGQAAPEYIYLSRVLETKRGTTLALSSLFILVAERLGIPSYGTHLPGMVFVQLHTPTGRVFLAPGMQGKIIRKQDCLNYVRSRMIAWEDFFLDPADSTYMLALTLGNLIYFYNKGGDEEKTAHLKEYLGVVQSSYKTEND